MLSCRSTPARRRLEEKSSIIPKFDSTMIAHNLETPRVNDIFQYSMLMGMSRTERERSDEP
jgi:hypothetical protein